MVGGENWGHLRWQNVPSLYHSETFLPLPKGVLLAQTRGPFHSAVTAADLRHIQHRREAAQAADFWCRFVARDGPERLARGLKIRSSYEGRIRIPERIPMRRSEAERRLDRGASPQQHGRHY